MIVILKMNPAEYGCKLQGYSTAPRFALSLSDVVCLSPGINCSVLQPELQDCQIFIAPCLRERMSADVWLKWSQQYYMKLMLTIKSGCMVSLTIPVLLTVISKIVLCSRWVNVATLTSKMQLASILSITCNIHHLAQQQSQYKQQWSMLRKRTFCHGQWANIGNWQRGPPNNVIKHMKEWAASKQKESEPLWYCTA